MKEVSATASVSLDTGGRIEDVPKHHPTVEEHYSDGRLLDEIRAGIRAIGKTPQSVTVDELAPVDEFHIGGRQASEDFIGQLGLSPSDHVLDVGCGFGGTSRFVASRYGCRVTGIDLTPEFIEAGRALCSWVGLSGRIELHHGSALAMPFEASAFEAAFMLHVGMNIPDKSGLFSEVRRVLKTGAVFGIYDVMRKSSQQLVYPVPWATSAETSELASVEEYEDGLRRSGFEVINVRDRRQCAAEFFEAARKQAEAAGDSPPLGVHVAMGQDAPLKIRNMMENIAADRVSPIEVIARRTG